MELEKMTITAYADPEFQTQVSSLQPLKVNINPESYSRRYEPPSYLEGSDIILANGEIVNSKFVDPPPETFKIDLWFDGTGAIQGSSDVVGDINRFKEIALLYNGKIHSNNYVVIEWGNLIFKGQLKNLSIDYQLFRPDGTPLRAKAAATFKQFIDAETREKMKLKSSPDLTHIRIVKAGDTLPLMCYRIYRDSSYYLEVAEKNGLANFTHIRPGQEIMFPPLEK